MNKILVVALLSCLGYLGCQQEKYMQGRIIYETLCLNCHMADGSGMGALYPKLQGSSYLSTQKHELPCLIKYGNQSEQLETVYMPGHPDIAEASMTNLVNYLSYTWGDQEVVLLSDVTKQLNSCPR